MYFLIVTIIIIIIIILYYMSMPPALPAGIMNGDSVKCPEDAKIYRIDAGLKRWYPNPTIYTKYGAPPFKTLTCMVLNAIPSGADMM